MALRDQPLGLPAGSVRAILAFLIIGAAIVQAIRTGVIPEGLSILSVVVMEKYFKHRNGNSIPKPKGPSE